MVRSYRIRVYDDTFLWSHSVSEEPDVNAVEDSVCIW